MVSDHAPHVRACSCSLILTGISIIYTAYARMRGRVRRSLLVHQISVGGISGFSHDLSSRVGTRGTTLPTRNYLSSGTMFASWISSSRKLIKIRRTFECSCNHSISLYYSVLLDFDFIIVSSSLLLNFDRSTLRLDISPYVLGFYRVRAIRLYALTGC